MSGRRKRNKRKRRQQARTNYDANGSASGSVIEFARLDEKTEAILNVYAPTGGRSTDSVLGELISWFQPNTGRALAKLRSAMMQLRQETVQTVKRLRLEREAIEKYNELAVIWGNKESREWKEEQRELANIAHAKEEEVLTLKMKHEADRIELDIRASALRKALDEVEPFEKYAAVLKTLLDELPKDSRPLIKNYEKCLERLTKYVRDSLHKRERCIPETLAGVETSLDYLSKRVVSIYRQWAGSGERTAERIAEITLTLKEERAERREKQRTWLRRLDMAKESGNEELIAQAETAVKAHTASITRLDAVLSIFQADKL